MTVGYNTIRNFMYYAIYTEPQSYHNAIYGNTFIDDWEGRQAYDISGRNYWDYNHCSYYR